MVISLNCLTVDYYKLYDNMGQLLTLMVFGDMVTSDADNTRHLQRQSQQSTAERSAAVTRYRAAEHSDDDEVEFEEDEERSGALYTELTSSRPHDLERSCSGDTGTTDERRQGEESDTNGAGHCSGELRCDPSVMESWSSSVHQHRTGLIGNGRVSASSSGGGTGADDDDGNRLQLMKIMCIA